MKKLVLFLTVLLTLSLMISNLSACGAKDGDGSLNDDSEGGAQDDSDNTPESGSSGGSTEDSGNGSGSGSGNSSGNGSGNSSGNGSGSGSGNSSGEGSGSGAEDGPKDEPEDEEDFLIPDENTPCPTATLTESFIGYKTLAINALVQNSYEFDITNARIIYKTLTSERSDALQPGKSYYSKETSMDANNEFTIRIVCDYTYRGTEYKNVVLLEKKFELTKFELTLSAENVTAEKGKISFELEHNGKFISDSSIRVKLYKDGDVLKTIDYPTSVPDYLEKITISGITRGDYKIEIYNASKEFGYDLSILVAEFDVSADFEYFTHSVKDLTSDCGTLSLNLSLTDDCGILDYARLDIIDSEGNVSHSFKNLSVGENALSYNGLLPEEKYTLSLYTKYFESDLVCDVREVMAEFTASDYECYPTVEIVNLSTVKNEMDLRFRIIENSAFVDRVTVVINGGGKSKVVTDLHCDSSGYDLSAIYRLLEPLTDYTVEFYLNYSLFGNACLNTLTHTESFKSDDHSYIPTLTLTSPHDVKDGYIYTSFSKNNAAISRFYLKLYRENGELIIDETRTTVSGYIYTGKLVPGKYRISVSCDFTSDVAAFMSAADFLLVDEEITVTEASFYDTRAKLHDTYLREDGSLTFYYRAYSSYLYDTLYMQIINENGDVIYQNSDVSIFHTLEDYDFDEVKNNFAPLDFWTEHTVSGLDPQCDYTVRFVSKHYYADENVDFSAGEKTFLAEREESSPMVEITDISFFKDTVRFDFTFDADRIIANDGILFQICDSRGLLGSGYNHRVTSEIFKSGVGSGELWNLEPNTTYNIVAMYEYKRGANKSYAAETVATFTTPNVALPTATIDLPALDYSTSGKFTINLVYDKDLFKFDGDITVRVSQKGSSDKVETVSPDKLPHEFNFYLFLENMFTVTVTGSFQFGEKYYSDYTLLREEYSSIRKEMSGSGLKISVSGDEATVTGVDYNTLYYKIPDTYEGKPVTKIAANAFANNPKAKFIELGKNVKEIGDGAFSGCTKLTNISIPDSLTKIGSSAFKNCSSLSYMTLPDSVTSVGAEAFFGCSAITELDLGGAEKLNDGTLNGCTALKTLRCSSVSEVAPGVFSECTALVFVYCESLVDIPAHTFEGLTSLARVYYSPLTTEIGDYAFAGCTNLAFHGTYGVKRIGAYAFSDLKYANKAYCYESLEYIGEGAFKNTPIVYIYLPATLTYIGKDAFKSDRTIDVFEYGGTVTELCKIELGGEGAMPKMRPDSIVRVKRGGDELPDYNFYIGDGVEEIQPYIFAGWNTGSIYIHDSVKIIGEGAFSGAHGVKKLRLGAGVTEIGKNAFSDVTVGVFYYYGTLSDWAGISLLGSGANPVSSSTEIRIKDKLLLRISLPDTVREIGQWQFSGWNVEKIILTGITSFGEGAFFDASCDTLLLGADADFIGIDAFRGMTVRVRLDFSGEPYALTKFVTSYGAGIELAKGAVLRAYGYHNNSSAVSYLTVRAGEDIPWSALSAFGDISRIYVYDHDGVLPHDLALSLPYLTYSTYEGSKYVGCKENPYKILVSTTAVGTLKIHPDTEVILPLGNINLDSVYIPGGIKSIYTEAFARNASVISNVYFGGNVSEWAEIEFASKGSNPLWNATNGNLFCYDELTGKYLQIQDAHIYSERISAYAFYNIDTLRNVYIHTSVTSVGEYAFACTSALKIYTYDMEKTEEFDPDWNCYFIYGTPTYYKIEKAK